jgi:hypothetical protein
MGTFFCIPGGKRVNMTAKRFLDAVSKNMNDEAESLLSKRLTAMATVDFDGLRRMVERGAPIKYVSAARRRLLPRNIDASSVMLTSGGGILNLYMVSEPDDNSDLKIIGIQED